MLRNGFFEGERLLFSAINPIDAIVRLRFTKNEMKINVCSCKKKGKKKFKKRETNSTNMIKNKD